MDADWPYLPGTSRIVILNEPVVLDEYAVLPELGLLDELIPESGQTDLEFTDVGYGQTGNEVGGGPPRRAFPLERRQAVQNYSPGGEGGIGHGDRPVPLPAERAERAARLRLRRRLRQPRLNRRHQPAGRSPHWGLPAQEGVAGTPDLAEPPPRH